MNIAQRMQALLEDTSDIKICYGPQRLSVLPSGIIPMDHVIPIREGAARLAHMGHHGKRHPPSLAPIAWNNPFGSRQKPSHRASVASETELNPAGMVLRIETEWRQTSHPVTFLRILFGPILMGPPVSAIGSRLSTAMCQAKPGKLLQGQEVLILVQARMF